MFCVFKLMLKVLQQQKINPSSFLEEKSGRMKRQRFSALKLKLAATMFLSPSIEEAIVPFQLSLGKFNFCTNQPKCRALLTFQFAPPNNTLFTTHKTITQMIATHAMMTKQAKLEQTKQSRENKWRDNIHEKKFSRSCSHLPHPINSKMDGLEMKSRIPRHFNSSQNVSQLFLWHTFKNTI